MEKHPPTGSTVTEVIEGWTDTMTGALVTPPAVTVMVVDPTMGLPDASLPLQTTKIESHTPPHTWPAGETVAILVFDELNVKTVLILVLAEFTAPGVIVTTSPAFIERLEGVTLTTATTLAVDDEPPPQPAANDKKSVARIAIVPAR
jgi:hypothetical protein